MHVLGVPVDLGALREQRLALLEQPHEPLARRHELERAVALLVELHRVLDRLRLAAQRRAVAGGAAGRVAQQLDGDLLRLRDVLAGELGVERFALAGSRLSKPGLPNSTAASRPLRCTSWRSASRCSRHHSTSVASPNVHTIRMPVPFSGSASSLGKIGTGTRKSGVIARLPNSAGSARRPGAR